MMRVPGGALVLLALLCCSAFLAETLPILEQKEGWPHYRYPDEQGVAEKRIWWKPTGKRSWWKYLQRSRKRGASDGNAELPPPAFLKMRWWTAFLTLNNSWSFSYAVDRILCFGYLKLTNGKLMVYNYQNEYLTTLLLLKLFLGLNRILPKLSKYERWHQSAVYITKSQ